MKKYIAIFGVFASVLIIGTAILWNVLKPNEEFLGATLGGGAVVRSSSLVGLWTLDGTGLVEGTGKDSLTKTGTVTSRGGKIGGGQYFNGGFLTVPAHSDFVMGEIDFSVNFWIYRDGDLSGDTGGGIISFGLFGTSRPNGWGVVRSGNALLFEAGSTVGRPSTGVIPDKTWVNIHGQRQSGVLSIYVNGVLTNTSSFVANLTFASVGIFGTRQSAIAPVTNFILDHVRIYRAALSNTEITALFQESKSEVGVNPPSGIATSSAQVGVPDTYSVNNGLVGYYPLDKDYNDYSGNGNHATQEGSTLVRFWTGKIGGSFYARTNSSRVVTPISFNAADDFSTSIWFNPEVLTGDLGLNSIWGSSATTLGVVRITTNNGNLVIFWETGSGSQPTGVVPPINQWSHLAVVKTNGLVRVYLNSVIIASFTVNNTDVSAIRIGNTGTGSRGLYGKLDEARIYNRALTQLEITQLYNMGR
jgi:hypothetical protein